MTFTEGEMNEIRWRGTFCVHKHCFLMLGYIWPWCLPVFIRCHIDNTHSPKVLRLHIKQLKTDPFRKCTYIHLGRTYQNVCPVQAMLLYLAIRGKQPGLLFVLSDNTMLTRRYFPSALKDTISKLNLDTHSYNTHSFRIGAATSAKQAGISDTQIKTLGRWLSDA